MFSYLRELKRRFCLWVYGKLKILLRTIPRDCPVPVQICLLIYLCIKQSIRKWFSHRIFGFRAIRGEWRILALGITAYSFITFFIFLFLPYQRGLDLLKFFVYMTAGTTFIPLPTPTWVMLYGGRFNPVLIAFVGSIGTAMACLPDYPLISSALRYEKIAKLKTTKTYQFSIRFFYKVPFISLVIAAFTPIPWEPLRFLAAATRYKRFRYILSVFLGRAPRYFLLAKIQRDFLSIPDKWLWGSILLVLLIILMRRCLGKPKILVFLLFLFLFCFCC